MLTSGRHLGFGQHFSFGEMSTTGELWRLDFARYRRQKAVTLTVLWERGSIRYGESVLQQSLRVVGNTRTGHSKTAFCIRSPGSGLFSL